jgi:hypothetical protein
MWSPNPEIAGSIMVTTKVAARCKGPQTGGKAYFGLTTVDGDGVAATVFYAFDRRLKWIENSLLSPASVTAGDYAGGRHGICPKVPRTFVNQASCVRLPVSACLGA